MKKYIVRYDAGYGPMYDEIRAENDDEADNIAYDIWRESVESEADYEAMPWTQELADNFL